MATQYVAGLAGLDSALRQLPAKLASGLAIRATSAGAKVIQDAIKERAPIRHDAVPIAHGSTGKRRRVKPHEPGYLKQHISRRRARGSSTVTSYKIGPTKGAFYASFLEFGTKFVTRRPFMRPALDAARDKAVDAVATTLRNGLDELVRSVK